MTAAFIYSVEIFLGYILLHIFISYFSTPTFFLKQAALVWLLYLGLVRARWDAPNGAVTVFVLFFAFSFWTLYILALVAARNSVTLRMMDEIARAKTLSREQIEQKFSAEESLRARIQAMELNGFLTLSPAKDIQLTNKGRNVGLCAVYLRKIFSLAQSG